MNIKNLFRRKKPEPQEEERNTVENSNRLRQNHITFVSDPAKVVSPSIGYVSTGAFFDPHPYYNKLEKLYLTNADYAAPISVIVSLLFRMGFKFKSNDEKMIQKFEEWAEATDFYEKLKRTVTNMLVFGNGYMLITKYPGEGFINLQELHPRWVYARTDEFGRVIGWEIRGYYNDKEMIVKPEDIIVLKEVGIGVGPYGIPLGLPAYDIIKQKEKLEKIAYIMAHRASHGLLHVTFDSEGLSRAVDPNTGLSEVEEYQMALSKAFSERVRERPDGTVEISNNIVTEDRVKTNEITIKNDLSGVAEIINILKLKIRAQERTPSIFLGDPVGTNRATSYNEIVAFAAYLKSLWQHINTQLQKLLKVLNIDGRFVYDEVIRDDEQVAVKNAWWINEMYLNGSLTLEEARKLISEQLNVELDPDVDIVPPRYPTATPRTPANIKQPVPRGDQPTEYHSHDHTITMQSAPIDKTTWDGLEKEWKIELPDGVMDLEAKLKAYLKEYADKVWQTIQDKVLSSNTPEDALMDIEFDTDNWDDIFFEEVAVIWAMYMATYAINQVMYDPTMPLVQSLMAEEEYYANSSISKLNTQIKDTVMNDIRAGKTTAEMKADVYNLIRRYDTKMVAETEVMRVANTARAADLAAGGKHLVRVLPVLDERTCPICVQLMIDTWSGVPVEEGRKLLPAHPNCRCVLIPAQEG